MNNLDKEIAKKQAELEKLLEQRKAEQEMTPIAFDPEGTWKVTTEGDCEGRSINHIGTYKGNILDIVKDLSARAYYKLTVSRVVDSELSTQRSAYKEVSFNINWEKGIELHNKKDHLRALTQHLRDGETLEESNYHGSVLLKWED